MNNLDGKTVTKDSIKSKVDSGIWSTLLPDELIDPRHQIARYDSHSRNVQDMWEQKDLWIKMHEATEGYDVLAFRSGLSHHASFIMKE